MDDKREPRGALDKALGVLIRVLWAAVFALGGAWAATAIPVFGGRWVPGCVAGLVVIGVIFLKEPAFVKAVRKHSTALAIAGLLLYVAVLACAVYSELFSLEWFDWLPG